MAAIRLSERNSTEFREKFLGFEDGVITGIRLHLPRSSVADRTATIDVQAMDAMRNGEWCLVQITIKGVYEYQFPLSRKFSYFILSDGLNLECTSGRCILDLDPGPDDWLPDRVGLQGEYSKQYIIGKWCEYEELDGPFI